MAVVLTMAVSLVATTGIAHALTDEVLLTEPEAKAASGYAGTLTAQNVPVPTPGVLIRQFKGGEFGLDTFGVYVIDPSGSSPTKDDPKKTVEEQIALMKQSFPGLECKVYEQSGTKITTVCWSNDPVMVMGFSSDIKTYTKKKKVKGKWKRVIVKQIPVLGTSSHILDEAESVSEAAKDRAAAEAKGLRNAQMAKLPATYS